MTLPDRCVTVLGAIGNGGPTTLETTALNCLLPLSPRRLMWPRNGCSAQARRTSVPARAARAGRPKCANGLSRAPYRLDILPCSFGIDEHRTRDNRSNCLTARTRHFDHIVHTP